MQTSPGSSHSLPRHCSNAPVDTLLFRGATGAIGAFRCPVEHPTFSHSGPAERCIVVFPRTSVWIQHEGSRAFVADPTVVTIYNRGQRYVRRPLSPEGDRCDWFGVSDAVARDITDAFDPRASRLSSRPFQFEVAPISAALYMEQRLAMQRAAAGVTETLETEEMILRIVSGALALAYGSPPAPLPRRTRATRHRRELVEHAKSELLRTMTANRSVTDIAAAVGTSPFHLCRIFRAHTGRTMHEYRTELRLRMALEHLASSAGMNLSQVAHELGFASHAHFVRVCQAHFGMPPGALRKRLAAFA